MEIVKSDLSRFKSINDFPYKENDVDFDGMQMHYIAEGNGDFRIVRNIGGKI